MRGDLLKLGLGALVAVGVVWCLINFVQAESARRQNWIQRCIADGNKDYECEERWKLANPDPKQVVVHHR